MATCDFESFRLNRYCYNSAQYDLNGTDLWRYEPRSRVYHVCCECHFLCLLHRRGDVKAHCLRSCLFLDQLEQVRLLRLHCLDYRHIPYYPIEFVGGRIRRFTTIKCVVSGSLTCENFTSSSCQSPLKNSWSLQGTSVAFQYDHAVCFCSIQRLYAPYAFLFHPGNAWIIHVQQSDEGQCHQWI